MATSTTITTTTTQSIRCPPIETGQSESDAYLDRLIAEKTVLVKSIIADDAGRVLKKLSNANDREDWANLLRAAPTALTSLGFCFAAAKLAGAGAVEQTHNKDLAADLKTNINRCYDDGLLAFKEAETKMRSISKCIDDILGPCGIMDDIEGTIEEARENLADDVKFRNLLGELKKLLQQLQTTAQNCTADSESVVEKFDNWMSLARDINVAFTEAQAQEEKKRKELGIMAQLGRGVKRFFGFSSAKERAKSTPEERKELLQFFSTATEHDVIEVLRFCLNSLKTIKANLEELQSFFSRLHIDIKDIDKEKIQKLLDLAGEKGKGSVRDTNKGKKIHIAIMNIRIGYMLAGAKTAIYAKASRSHIMTGVRLVTDLSQETGESIEEQIEDLIKYSEDAREAADKLVIHAERAERVPSFRIKDSKAIAESGVLL